MAMIDSERQGMIAIIECQDIEIKLLKKGLEWLMNNVVYEKKDRDWIEKQMYQILKH